MGKLSIHLKKMSLVWRTEGLPQDGQRLISRIKNCTELDKELVLEFEATTEGVKEKGFDEELVKYRQQLIEIEQKIGESFLKTILVLSGGALGLSFAFIKDVIGKGPMVIPNALIASWSLLTISLASVLLCLYIGTIAYRRAIKQVDEGKIYQQSPGGKSAYIMPILNFITTFSFVLGIIFLFIFAFKNIGG